MNERRKYPRLERTLLITLKGDAFHLSTETKNISGSGAYCQVSRPIPELSKPAVTLLIPVTAREEVGLQEIECEGVVVRSERILRDNGTPEKYFIAIYFTRMGRTDRSKLRQYVSHQLMEKSDDGA